MRQSNKCLIFILLMLMLSNFAIYANSVLISGKVFDVVTEQELPDAIIYMQFKLRND